MMFTVDNLLRPKNYSGQQVQWIQTKRDGLRLLVSKDTAGYITAMTREGKTDFWPELRRIKTGWVDSIVKIPMGTALDCELDSPGTQATDIKTLVLAGSASLELSPFAMPMYKGYDCRGVEIILANNYIGDMGFTPVPVKKIDDEPVTLSDRVLDSLKREATKLGTEGWIIKLAHYNGWYKIKPIRTVDCVITGYEISTSDTYFGGLKNIQVSLYDNECQLVKIADVGSGFEGRYKNNVDPTTLLDRVCEIAYDSLASKGKLKFPRFLRWRDDKPAVDCTKDQLL